MFTCSKRYADIPFAHRQHRHAGHCALIHGHNWTFTFTFAAEALDACGFVIDFGGLGFLKDWIHQTFDHACCFNRDDSEGLAFARAHPHYFKTVILDNCSAEGIAVFLFEEANRRVRESTGGRVRVISVEVHEDPRNAARYEAPVGSSR